MAAQLSGIGRIVSETKGLKTENEYHSAAWDHGLYKPFKPASLPGTLTYTGAMYNSTDQGATWEKAHSFEAKKQRAQHIQTVKEQLDCATNIVCGEDTIDGIVYDTCITQCMTNTGSIAKPVTSSSRQRYSSRENRKPSRRRPRGRSTVARMRIFVFLILGMICLRDLLQLRSKRERGAMVAAARRLVVETGRIKPLACRSSLAARAVSSFPPDRRTRALAPAS